MPSENAHFSIIYDGEALAEGSIDAKDLAPALLALAEVIEEAQPLVPELDARLSLRVRSDFERGSFEIHLDSPSSTSSSWASSPARRRPPSPISSGYSASRVSSASSVSSSSSSAPRAARPRQSPSSAASA